MEGAAHFDSMESYQDAIYMGMDIYSRMKHGEDRAKQRIAVTSAMTTYNKMAGHKIFNTATWWFIYNSK